MKRNLNSELEADLAALDSVIFLRPEFMRLR